MKDSNSDIQYRCTKLRLISGTTPTMRPFRCRGGHIDRREILHETVLPGLKSRTRELQ
jgi:hypothetical protein